MARPGSRTVILEMALVELVPTKVWLNTVTVGLTTGTPVNRGTVAIEGRIRDGASGKVIATFADREVSKASIVNRADLTWYFHAHRIIDEWAAQLVALVNARESEIVKRSSPFTLKPW